MALKANIMLVNCPWMDASDPIVVVTVYRRVVRTGWRFSLIKEYRCTACGGIVPGKTHTHFHRY